MFQQGKEKTFDDDSATRKVPVVIWKGMSVTELLKYRDEIDAELPARKLAEVNLEEQMLLQFYTLRELQTKVLGNDDVAANQQSQVANSVSSSLRQLTELQEKLYTQERYKKLENLLIRHLVRLPEDVAEAFLTEFKVVVGDE